MAVGGRNRLMTLDGATIPYRPGKNDLLEATRRVSAVLASGGVLAIAGEGRIHASEHELLPLEEGPAYFALRVRRAARPDRDQRHELAPARAARSRSSVGEPIPAVGPAAPRGGRRADRRAAGRRSTRSSRDRPDFAAAGPGRALADRGLQRLAGGVARGAGPASSPTPSG